LLLSHSIASISFYLMRLSLLSQFLLEELYSQRSSRVVNFIVGSSTLSDSYAGIELSIDAELMVLQHDCGGTIGQF